MRPRLPSVGRGHASTHTGAAARLWGSVPLRRSDLLLGHAASGGAVDLPGQVFNDFASRGVGDALAKNEAARHQLARQLQRLVTA